MIKNFQHRLVPLFPWLLLLFNLLAKGLFLTSQEISHDEPFSIYHAQFDAGPLLTHLETYNNPPLFELMLHFWIKLFGISPWSVRILPWLFASLSPVCLYFLGKRFFTMPIAIGSSLLLSFSNIVTYHAHDCRVYTLFLLLSILSMYHYLALTTEQLPKLRIKLFFILISALLIYAHYFGFIVLFIQGAHLLFCHRKHIVKFIVYYLLIAVLYLPHLWSLLFRFTDTAHTGTWLGPPAGIESLYDMLRSFSNMPVPAVACIALLVIGLIMGIIAARKNGIDSKVVLLCLWFLVPYLGMFCISYKMPMYIRRYLIFSLPAYYMLVVHCIELIPAKNMIRNSLLAVLVFGFAFTTEFDPVKETHMRAAANAIRGAKTARTAVFICPYYMIEPFAYNYDRTAFKAVGDQKEYNLTDSLLRVQHMHMLFDSRDIRMDFGQFEKVIYFQVGDEGASQRSGIPQVLEKQFTLTETRDLHDGYRIFIYERKKL